MNENIFSTRLKELRKEKQTSQSKLAKILDFSQVYICRWEKGTRTPNIYDLVKIAKFFDVSTDYLLGLSDF